MPCHIWPARDGSLLSEHHRRSFGLSCASRHRLFRLAKLTITWTSGIIKGTASANSRKPAWQTVKPVFDGTPTPPWSGMLVNLDIVYFLACCFGMILCLSHALRTAAMFIYAGAWSGVSLLPSAMPGNSSSAYKTVTRPHQSMSTVSGR